MASITERQRADGTVAYKCDVVVRVDGRRVKRSATFDRASTAKAWAGRVEKEIWANGVGAIHKRVEPTVAEAVEKVLAAEGEGMGKTKHQVLKFISDGRAKISSIKLADLHSSDVRALADRRVTQVAQVRRL